jgi:hypothetical protein
MKSFLGKRGVIDSILNFDCHNISSKARNEVQKLLKQKAQSFQHEVRRRRRSSSDSLRLLLLVLVSRVLPVLVLSLSWQIICL